MTSIKCSIGSINLPNGDPADGRYYVRHDGIIRSETFYKNVGRRCGYSPAMARAVGESMFEELAELLQRCYRIELPQMSAFLTMRGKKAAEAKGHESVKGSPVVHLQPRGEFKDCCKDAFEMEVVTPQASVVVRNFADRCMQDGAIGNGTNVKVTIIGLGLYMPDPTDPTVGVWIEDADGIIRARAVVDESTNTTMAVHFPKIDLPEGSGYRLCVASRFDLPGRHSVRTVRRRLTILPAHTAKPVVRQSKHQPPTPTK